MFASIIIISSFTVLNLFIAIIVDSMQAMHEAEEERTVERIEMVVDQDTRLVSSEITLLREEVRALREALQNGRP